MAFQLLSRLTAIDYSFLVGIHYPSLYTEELASGNECCCSYNEFVLPHVYHLFEIGLCVQTNLTLPFRRSFSTTVSSSGESKVLLDDDGFICDTPPSSTSSSPLSSSMIVYVGIIDVLQPYNLRKRLEHGTLLLRGYTAVSCSHHFPSISFVSPRIHLNERLHNSDNKIGTSLLCATTVVS
jgi:hypothetical protein